jgi:hypothetical protein
MYRYPVGRGRWLAAIAGVIILVGCLLPWYTVGGQTGLPPITGNAFESTGILVFLAGLATLALVTLPYAAGDRPVGLDRWPPYLIILLVGLVGVLLRLPDLIGDANRIWPPTRSPGLWLVAIGLLLLARATFEISQTPNRT